MNSQGVQEQETVLMPFHTVTRNSEPVTLLVGHLVGPRCGADEGMWYCATHQVGFGNQTTTDLHVLTGGEHRLAWACAMHGVEAYSR